MNGFNLKYRYEQDNNPLGVIGSFTYTEKIVLTVLAITTKLSTTASPPVLLTV
ncbi:outer membrane protein X [Citrobacter koseri]|uniref:Outer membrane protein X n=1 Tax=Citrobacter koseri TaxID=545 RepID=A0A2X2V2P2_CITKO|nr:outer membrane protein X [Citrobacter koseri]